MTITPEIKRFIDDYYGEMIAGNAAIFAGAGLSVPAGFVDWKDLLRPLAVELELNIDLESDFVQLAQFHVNANGSNRHRLHVAIVDALSSGVATTKNHTLLSRLPITTYWTTNYDELIEGSLNRAGKIVDTKWSVPQLAITRPRRDVVVYKMHGDVSRPDEAVVTKDDYERYSLDKGAFITALAGDLVSKTFLFLGFSFTDPNLEQVLARVRITFAKNQRRHYAIFRKRKQGKEEPKEHYEHAVIRQALVVEDLKRFNIKVLLVDEYEDITDILAELDLRYRTKTVFVGAALAEFAPWGEEIVKRFMHDLGRALIRNDFRLATGVGAGVGNSLLTGAIDETLRSHKVHLEDAIIMRPFPLETGDKDAREALWEAYRRDLIAQAGVAVFLFGNKTQGGKLVTSDGMVREYEIAKEMGLKIIALAETGGAAAEIAERESKDAKAVKLADDLRQLASEIIQRLVSLRNR